jgi:hypothetical protein
MVQLQRRMSSCGGCGDAFEQQKDGSAEREGNETGISGAKRRRTDPGLQSTKTGLSAQGSLLREDDEGLATWPCVKQNRSTVSGSNRATYMSVRGVSV